MSGHRFLETTACLVLLATGAGAAGAQTSLRTTASGGVSPMTFEEVMTDQRRLEGAKFSPDGARLAYGWARSDRPTAGLAFPVGQHEAFIVDAAGGAPRPMVRPDGDAAAFLQPCEPWRPDSEGVSLIVLKDGRLAMAYADADSGEVTTLGLGAESLCSVWVGTNMVYATAADGAPGGVESQRSLEWLTRRWQAAWAGGPAEVTVHSSNPDFPAPEQDPAAGGLVVADTQTGQVDVIAAGRFSSIVASSDGKTFAALKQGSVAPSAFNTMTGRRAELQVFRIDGEGTRLIATLADFDSGYMMMRWSPDGQKLLVGGRTAEGQLALRVMSTDGSPVRSVAIPPHVSIANAAAAVVEPILPLGWIAGRPAFIGETAGRRARSADAGSDYGQNREVGRGVYVATDTGAEALTGFSSASVEGFATTAHGDGLVVTDGSLWRLSPGQAARQIPVEGHRLLGLSRVSGSGQGQPTFLVTGDGAAERVAISAENLSGQAVQIVVRLVDGKVLFSTPTAGLEGFSADLDAAASVHQEGWTGVLRTEGEVSRDVAVANPEWRDRPLGETRRLTYEVDGLPTTSWVLLPPGYSGGALPALVWIYGGQVFGAEPPRASRPETAVTPIFSGQLWAASGYAVIYPSVPIGQGSAGDVGDSLARSTIAAVDAAVATGAVDPDKVALFGHSFGGYSTAAVLARRSDRFKAGAAVSGVYDFLSAWGARPSWEKLVDPDGHSFDLETRAYIEKGQMQLGVPPWEDSAAYLRASPLFRASDITTPLMLMVGDLDLGATDVSQSERLYAALRRTGNPAVMVRYWGQRHAQEDPGAVRDEWERLSSWFAHYLK